MFREVLHDPTLELLLFLPASGTWADVRGGEREVDPDRPSVRIDRRGAPDVVVQHAATAGPVVRRRSAPSWEADCWPWRWRTCAWS